MTGCMQCMGAQCATTLPASPQLRRGSATVTWTPPHEKPEGAHGWTAFAVLVQQGAGAGEGKEHHNFALIETGLVQRGARRSAKAASPSRIFEPV